MQRKPQYLFNGAVRAIGVIVFAAAGRVPQQHPVGCAVAGPAESFRVDESFQVIDRVPVEALPILRDPAGHATQDVRCQMLH